MLEIRASDARSIILPFTLSHAAILIILGFGGNGLKIRCIIAAMAVLAFWCVAWLDDCIQDLVAGSKDLSDEAKIHIWGDSLMHLWQQYGH